MKNGSLKTAIILFATISVLASSAALLSRTAPARSGAAGRTNPMEALALSMTREMRQLLASYTWLRIDQYFHSTGLKMRENTEIVPLLRLVTLFDPSFVDAYIVLACHLADHLGRKREALEIIREGIKNNMGDGGKPLSPRVSELYFGAGWIFFTHFHETAEAALSISQGRKYLTPECDTDDVYLAGKLLDYIARNSTEELAAAVKMPEKTIEGGGQSHSGEPAQESRDDDGCDDPDHAFAGQNPWHDPGTRDDLSRVTGVYIVLSVFVFAGAAFGFLKKR